MSTKVKTKRKKAGRPKTVITIAQWKQIGDYALEGCMNGTIAALMDWDREFIQMRPDILTFLHKKRAQRKLKLREAQNKHLNNPIMGIFLGKNELGQADKQETKLSGAVELLAPSVSMLK